MQQYILYLTLVLSYYQLDLNDFRVIQEVSCFIIYNIWLIENDWIVIAYKNVNTQVKINIIRAN